LRAAQHLDAVDVRELLHQEAALRDLPDAVDVGADVRDAAHAEIRTACAAAAAGDDDVRDRLADVLERVEAARLQGVAGECDDGDRDFL